MIKICEGRGKGSPAFRGQTASSDCPRPSWAEQPLCEAGFCAVGIGRSLETGFERTRAEADGRDKLAHTLERTVIWLAALCIDWPT